jgi:hypothetical protein
VSPKPVPNIRRSSCPSAAPVQSPVFKPLRASRAIHAGRAALLSRVVLYAPNLGNKNPRFAGVLSPLPDSNRGPPPYHGDFAFRRCGVRSPFYMAVSLRISGLAPTESWVSSEPDPTRQTPDLSPRPVPKGCACRVSGGSLLEHGPKVARPRPEGATWVALRDDEGRPCPGRAGANVRLRRAASRRGDVGGARLLTHYASASAQLRSGAEEPERAFPAGWRLNAVGPPRRHRIPLPGGPRRLGHRRRSWGRLGHYP